MADNNFHVTTSGLNNNLGGGAGNVSTSGGNTIILQSQHGTGLSTTQQLIQHKRLVTSSNSDHQQMHAPPPSQQQQIIITVNPDSSLHTPAADTTTYCSTGNNDGMLHQSPQIEQIVETENSYQSPGRSSPLRVEFLSPHQIQIEETNGTITTTTTMNNGTSSDHHYPASSNNHHNNNNNHHQHHSPHNNNHQNQQQSSSPPVSPASSSMSPNGGGQDNGAHSDNEAGADGGGGGVGNRGAIISTKPLRTSTISSTNFHGRLSSKDNILLVSEDLIEIGRNSSKSTVHFHVGKNSFVSRKHLLLQRDQLTGDFYLICLSKNGVFVDGVFQRKSQDSVRLPKQ
jgi:FHA domain